MKKALKYIIFLLLPCLSIAQNMVSATLKSEDGLPLQFLEVQLFNEDKHTTTSDFTDEEGHFKLKVEKGKYTFTIENFGEVLYSKPLIITESIDLGVIVISSSIQLGEVLLTREKKLIEKKIDGFVFNVKESTSLEGETAIDAIKQTPGVTVNNESITLLGKGNPIVLIDGKPTNLSSDQLLDYLSSISTSNIEKIEVMSTPPAKYEAEGGGGLINIVLIKNEKKAFDINIRSAYTQAYQPSFNEGVNLSYQTKRLSLISDLSYSQNKSVYTNSIHYDYPDYRINQSIKHKSSLDIINPILGIYYDLNNKNTLGINYKGSFSNMDTKERNNMQYFNNENILSKFNETKGPKKTKRDFTAINANYDYKIDTIGKKIALDIDYFLLNNTTNNSFNSRELSNENVLIEDINAINNGKQKIENYNGKIDVYLPLNKNLIEFGFKSSFSKTENTLSSRFFNEENESIQEDEFKYNENTQAVYISLERKINTAWTTKLGIRSEYTQIKTNSVKNKEINRDDYVKIFPTFYLQYKPNNHSAYGLSFGRRIRRPDFYQMNPNKWYMNAVSYVEGNPFLKPYFTYNLELSYNYKQLINTTMSYSTSEDVFSQVVYHDVENLSQRMNYENYANEKNIGVNINSNVNVFHWWNTVNELFFNYGILKPYLPIYTQNYYGWDGGYLRSIHNFTLDKEKNFKAALNFNYYMSSSGGLGQESGSSLNLSLVYTAMDKKLTLGLSFNDILKKDNKVFTSHTQNIRQRYDQYYDAHRFKLHASYKLGSGKTKKQEARTFGNQDEINRSN